MATCIIKWLYFTTNLINSILRSAQEFSLEEPKDKLLGGVLAAAESKFVCRRENLSEDKKRLVNELKMSKGFTPDVNVNAFDASVGTRNSQDPGGYLNMDVADAERRVCVELVGEDDFVGMSNVETGTSLMRWRLLTALQWIIVKINVKEWRGICMQGQGGGKDGLVQKYLMGKIRMSPR